MKKELLDEKLENINLAVKPKELGGNGISQLDECEIDFSEQ